MFHFFQTDKTRMVSPEEALKGRGAAMPVTARHFVLDTSLSPPFPEGMARIQVGMGCFWGAEKAFWKLDGVHTTAVGYGAGFTKNPTYEEVCSGRTGHNEVVLVVYDPGKISVETLLKTFWEGHDPTQGMRQGNDVGTQYRSGIYVYDEEQRAASVALKQKYEAMIRAAGHGTITTEIVDAGEFFYAEDGHQQYLAKNPHGYCGMGGTGVSCPVAWR